ncbi:MAG: alpha/beta fold hydrolase [Halioglobus sp.]
MSLPAVTLQRLLDQSVARVTDSDGCRIAWQKWSARTDTGMPPLVLLHGGFGSWAHWVHNISSLRKRRTVYTLDLPGLGDSGDMTAPSTTGHFAQLVLSGLDSLLGAHSPFALAGFSFGAMIAANLAADVGSRCSRLTLIGAAGCGQLHVQVPLLAPPSSHCPAAEAEAIQRENLGRLMLHDPASIDDLAVYIHANNLARHRFNSRKLSRSDELWAALPKVAAPVVGVWGAQDATAGGGEALVEREALFRTHQPVCEFHVLEDVGHWAMYEAPEQINRILDNH